MADLASLTADQLAEKVWRGLPRIYRAALAELQTRANKNISDEHLLAARAEAVEKERDEALARELESRHERGCTIYNANPPWTCSCGLEAAEARLAETQKALEGLVGWFSQEPSKALLGAAPLLKAARAALTIHPEEKP